MTPWETPPRTWGRPFTQRDAEGRLRNTPTDVGKTRWPTPAGRWAWKHPHGRGEDAFSSRVFARYFETPPRTWGRRFAYAVVLVPVGNTPTDVGKTAYQFDQDGIV